MPFYTAISPQTPAGFITIENNQERVDLQEPFRGVSPGLFFERIVPIVTRRKLSELKFRIWTGYIHAYERGHRFGAVIGWLQKRQEVTCRLLKDAGWRVYPFSLRLRHRMVVGLGAASVWETGIAWHRPTGLPYIPASALKGLARAQIVGETIRSAIDKWLDFQKVQYDDRKACLETIDKWLLEPKVTNPQEIRSWPKAVPMPTNVLQVLQSGRATIFRLFGHTQRAGLIEFLDAFPAEPPKFELDVMNVHYREYYQRERPQALDIESPNPVVFLTVADTPFRFVVLCDALRADDPAQADKLLQEAVKALQEGLRQMGIGAKTRLGYGLFAGPT